MAYTQLQYDTLKAAVAQGALRVKYADKEIEYRSLAEMYIILSSMEAELFPKSSSNRRYASFSKGI
jgi:hypothetical protein